MRKCTLIAGLLLLLSITLYASYICAATPLTEEQALRVLIQQIKKDKLYDSWTTLSCLLFYNEGETTDYFDFAIHEKHGDGCDGDPNTEPIVDRFRVNRHTRTIQWLDIEGEYQPYRAVLKFRSKIR